MPVADAKIAVDRASFRALLPSLVGMPNIKQQVRRVARSERERLENLRWRSTAKTLRRRLEDSVEDGDAEEIADSHSAYVRWVDRAAARRAIHPNHAARKKSQAAKLVAAATADD